MKISFTEEGMSIDNGTIDPRFKMATETGQYPGCYISSNPEELKVLIDLIQPFLTNNFNNNYWGKHTHLVWEAQSYNVAYADGIWVKGCSYGNRHTVPSITNFPINTGKIVRLTIKAFDGNECHGKPFISLEEISIPEEMVKYKGSDGNWINDWDD